MRYNVPLTRTTATRYVGHTINHATNTSHHSIFASMAATIDANADATMQLAMINYIFIIKQQMRNNRLSMNAWNWASKKHNSKKQTFCNPKTKQPSKLKIQKKGKTVQICDNLHSYYSHFEKSQTKRKDSTALVQVKSNDCVIHLA